jgi:hypothetical protein
MVNQGAQGNYTLIYETFYLNDMEKKGSFASVSSHIYIIAQMFLSTRYFCKNRNVLRLLIFNPRIKKGTAELTKGRSNPVEKPDRADRCVPTQKKD